MEFTIKKIISIDKNAQKFRDEMNKKIHMEQKDLENIILEMNEKSKIEIEKKNKEIIDIEIEKSNDEAKIILSQGDEKLNKIKKQFHEKKNNISQEIFNEIITSLWEE